MGVLGTSRAVGADLCSQCSGRIWSLGKRNCRSQPGSPGSAALAWSQHDPALRMSVAVGGLTSFRPHWCHVCCRDPQRILAGVLPDPFPLSLSLAPSPRMSFPGLWTLPRGTPTSSECSGLSVVHVAISLDGFSIHPPSYYNSTWGLGVSGSSPPFLVVEPLVTASLSSAAAGSFLALPTGTNPSPYWVPCLPPCLPSCLLPAGFPTLPNGSANALAEPGSSRLLSTALPGGAGAALGHLWSLVTLVAGR